MPERSRVDERRPSADFSKSKPRLRDQVRLRPADCTDKYLSPPTTTMQRSVDTVPPLTARNLGHQDYHEGESLPSQPEVAPEASDEAEPLGSDDDDDDHSVRYVRRHREPSASKDLRTGSESEEYANSSGGEDNGGVFPPQGALRRVRSRPRMLAERLAPESPTWAASEGHESAASTHTVRRSANFGEQSAYAIKSHAGSDGSSSKPKRPTPKIEQRARFDNPPATDHELDNQQLGAAEIPFSQGESGDAVYRRSQRDGSGRAHQMRSSYAPREREADGPERRSDHDSQELFRPAASKTALADLVPDSSPLPRPVPLAAHLPTWSASKGPEQTTSTPRLDSIPESDQELGKLLSEELLARLLRDPVGRHRFREWLSEVEKESVPRLDMLLDLQAMTSLVQHLKVSSESIHDVYLSSQSASQVSMPAQQGKLLLESLKTAYSLPVSVEHMQNHLLTSLYHGEFHRFVKSQLVEQAKTKLGKVELEGEERNGLGQCFCLSNPRLPENPIVLISDGFTEVTGYTRQSIIGRNCRFLQGPGTSPQAISRIREALGKGEAICELLLNYRRDSTPFWCLVNILPLRDSKGRLIYFIGGQANVTRSLSQNEGLRHLFGSITDGGGAEAQRHKLGGADISPTLAEHLRARLGKDGEGELRSIKLQGPVFSNDSAYAETASNASDEPLQLAMSRTGGIGPRTEKAESLRSASKLSLRSHHSGSTKKGGGGSSGTPEAQSSSNNDQLILGAESMVRPQAFSLEDQVRYYSEMYSQLLIMRRYKREVIFVTESLLVFLGMTERGSGSKKVYDSPLVHADMLSLLCGSDRDETKTIRANVKDRIEVGEEFSFMAGIKTVVQPGTHVPSKLGVKAARLWGTLAPRGNDRGTAKQFPQSKWVTVHMTPLRDREGTTYAFVAVFG
ncbi:hypothetical protein ACQY0O_002618 [Thecaphora frezii]